MSAMRRQEAKARTQGPRWGGLLPDTAFRSSITLEQRHRAANTALCPSEHCCNVGHSPNTARDSFTLWIIFVNHVLLVYPARRCSPPTRARGEHGLYTDPVNVYSLALELD